MSKKKIMGKIHNVAYGDYFGSSFNTAKIDENLGDLELEEKLMIIDNVIDYLYVNFKGLQPAQKGEEGDDDNGEFGSEDE